MHPPHPPNRPSLGSGAILISSERQDPQLPTDGLGRGLVVARGHEDADTRLMAMAPRKKRYTPQDSWLNVFNSDACTLLKMVFGI